MDLRTLLVAALVKAGRCKEDVSDEELVGILLPLIGAAEPVEKPEAPEAAPPAPPAPGAQADMTQVFVAMLGQKDPQAAVRRLTEVLSAPQRSQVELAIEKGRISYAEAKAIFTPMEQSCTPEQVRAALAAFPEGRIPGAGPRQATPEKGEGESLKPKAEVVLTEHQKSICKQQGITEAAYLELLKKEA